MVADGWLEGVIEKIGGQLASWSLGGLVDAFESPCDCFDLFLPRLSRFSRQTKTKAGWQIRANLVIEVFCPPFWHQVLFELSAIVSVDSKTMRYLCDASGLTLQISLLEEGRR